MANAILVDVNRCTGCWTCSQACKAAYKLDIDEYRAFVRTIGAGMDTAGGTWPNLYLKWNPVWKQSCLSCHGDESTGKKPFCVYNCPTGALTYGDPEDPTSEFSVRREKLRDAGYHMWQQPKWEDTRDNVYYIEKGI